MIQVEETTPYAWPFDGLRRSAFALVIVGVDARWFGRCEDAEAVARVLCLTAAEAQRLGAPVAHVRHRSDDAPLRTTDRSLGTADWELEAMGVDGCYGSALVAALRRSGRSQIAIAGFGLEGPVHSTLRSLNDRGLECMVIVDASAPMDVDLVPAALSTIELSGGIFGAVGRSPQLISALKEAP